MEKVRYPDGYVLLRNLDRDFPIVSHGEGVYLYDTNGKRYLDGSGGALVVSVGHGNKEIVDHISNQLSRVAYVNGTQFTSSVTEDLAARLCAKASAIGLDRASFLGSGSEAVEAAIKFARQLWADRGEPKRTKLIARAPSYHGNTLYALSASGRPHYKKVYGPLLSEVVVIPSTYEYRSPVANYAKDGGAHYAAHLEDAIRKEGPETIFAFIVEPIMGSSGGGSLPPPDYFKKVQEICRKYGILIIADEVLCGSGRTGKFFASEHFGLEPDILLLGKGLGGGYVPLSALLTKNEYVQEMKKTSGYFMHAQTYMMAPSMTVAGLATLAYMDKHQLVSNSEKMGNLLHRRLKEELSLHPHVGAITGKGLLAGVEFVEFKATKKPFDRKKKIAESITARAFQNGLTLWPNVGQADGTLGDLVLIGPPLVIQEPQVEELVAILKKTVQDFFS